MERRVHIGQMCVCALIAAVICVLGPLSIPIGEVPISLGTLGVYLAICLLGGRWGTVSVVVYLLVGFMGAPVFTGYTGGLGKLLGPTGGYLVAYPVLTLIAGLMADQAERWEVKGKAAAAWSFRIAGMAVGTAVLYLLGTVWFCVLSGSAVGYALAVCVIPFLPFDLIKIVAAIFLGTILRQRLRQAGLLQWAKEAEQK